MPVLPEVDGDEACLSASEMSPNSPVTSEKTQSEAAEVEVEANAKATLPPFYPFSPHSSGSGSDV